MSSTTRYKDGYREHVYVNGHRESKTFRTKREAKAWGAKREAELSQRAKAGRPTPGVLRGRCSLGAAHAGPSAMSTRALTLKSKGPWSRLSVWHHVPIKRVKAKAKGLCIVSRGATLDKPVFSHSLYKTSAFCGFLRMRATPCTPLMRLLRIKPNWRRRKWTRDRICARNRHWIMDAASSRNR